MGRRHGDESMIPDQIVDYRTIVIAEDDVQLSVSLMNFFETVLQYVVKVVVLRDDILPAIRQTQAGWLLLDIELKDGIGYDAIPLLRNNYGDDVFVIVLTGQWKRHSEGESLRKGADLVLRKPYPLSALKFQMERLMERGRIKPRATEVSRQYVAGDGMIDIAQGVFFKGDDEIHMGPQLMRVIRTLIEKTTPENKGWIPRFDMMIELWGEDAILDDSAKATYDARLRSLVSRINKTIGEGTVLNQRGERRAAFLKLICEEYEKNATLGLDSISNHQHPADLVCCG